MALKKFQRKHELNCQNPPQLWANNIKVTHHPPKSPNLEHNTPHLHLTAKGAFAMKIMTVLMLVLLCSCDPYGFGYKKNPAYVLDEAFKAIENLDLESFLEVTGKEALCLYANDKALDFLKNKIQIQVENLNLVPKVLKTSHYTHPVFVGFWAYYNEIYQVQITNKQTSQVLMETVIECNFGQDGEKKSKYQNLKPKNYKIKECRAIKLIPLNFEPIKNDERCSRLRVNL